MVFALQKPTDFCDSPVVYLSLRRHRTALSDSLVIRGELCDLSSKVVLSLFDTLALFVADKAL